MFSIVICGSVKDVEFGCIIIVPHIHGNIHCMAIWTNAHSQFMSPVKQNSLSELAIKSANC